MSLLKWKELAKRKTELGNKINYVHNAITQHKIGEETSKGSFDKLFKPVTSKLDDVIKSNLKSRMPQGRRPRKKGEVPNYRIDIEDELEDMNLGDLFDEAPVLPGSEKHRAEFSDTSGTFPIACSAKFEIARVKRRETIKKMAENGATSTTPYLFSFYTAH